MKCSDMLSGIAIGMVAGAALVMLMPTKRTACVKKQMKHTMQDIEGVMADAMEGIQSILNM